MIRRTMDIREVQNGFVVTTTIEREREQMGFSATNGTALSPYIRKELVVDSLPKLLKAVRAFFESEIITES